MTWILTVKCRPLKINNLVKISGLGFLFGSVSPSQAQILAYCRKHCSHKPWAIYFLSSFYEHLKPMQKVAVIAGVSLFVGGIFLYQVARLYHFKKIAEIEKKKEEVSKKFIDDSIARRRKAVLCTNPSLQSFFFFNWRKYISFCWNLHQSYFFQILNQNFVVSLLGVLLTFFNSKSFARGWQSASDKFRFWWLNHKRRNERGTPTSSFKSVPLFIKQL